MGYALFANRKLYLTSELNSLQLRLDQITQKRMDLVSFSGSIADDGIISADELINDLGNMDSYAQYNAGLQQYQTANPFSQVDANGNPIDIGTAVYGANATAEQKLVAQQQYNNEIAKKYAKNIEKQIEKQENQLELQQKKLETKISAVTKELEAVEQAEGQAIDRATPKYNGVG